MLWIKFFVAACAASGLMSSAAFAQADTTSSDSALTNVDASVTNKVPGQDVDEEITNNKLRAESGSKSKLSIAAALEYDAGSLRKPLGDLRPNIQATAATTDVANLNGTINVKYNLTNKDSLLLGGGVRWITPFSGFQIPKDEDGSPLADRKVDAFDPNLYYQRIYKIGDVQSYFQVGPTLYTRSDVTKIDYFGNVLIYNVNAYEIGKTGLTLGLESSVEADFFRKDPHAIGTKTAFQIARAQKDYNVFLYPYLEYAFTDKLNLRAVTFLASWEHKRSQRAWTFVQDKVIESVGIGISVTRDIFLYPNLQFVIDNVRPADTNIALAANINLF